MIRKKYARKKMRNFFFNTFTVHSRSQRNKKLTMMMMQTTLFGLGIRKPRSIWAYERREFWFQRVLNDFEDENFELHWRTDFRMKFETFMRIVELVMPRLAKQDTQLRRAIPIEKRVAIAIWRLSTGNSFRSVAKTFAVAKSTAVKISREFCTEIARLSPQFIKFPSSRRENAQAIEKFKLCYEPKLPQVVGAIDGTHVKIVAPNVEGKADYFSRKQCYSITTQGVVGTNLIFYDIATGFPGSCHDARNLRNSSLFRRAQNNELLIKPIDVVENSEIRPLLLGDRAYPLLPWLITPYQFGPAITGDQRNFNKRLSQSRVHSERAFGILKARWRSLLKRLDNRIENVSAVIITCCTLHNICQINNDEYIDNDEVLEGILRQERASRRRRRQNFEVNPDGAAIRLSLTNYVNN